MRTVTMLTIHDHPPQNNEYLQIRIHRLTLLGFMSSLLIHLVVLFGLPQTPITTGDTPAGTRGPLTVALNKSPQAGATTATELQDRTPHVAPRVRQRKTTTAKTLTAPSPATLPTPAPPPTVSAAAPTDMQSYIEAARARRRAMGIPDQPSVREASESAEAANADAARLTTVMRNLRSGTNGVFQMLNLDARSAAFSFRGWTTDASNSRREYIAVEIGANSTIELAVVRKMIDLIRRYYQGNFNWESQRLDRVVTLSARLEDNEGLEAFLLREFFGNPPRPSGVK